MESRFKVAGHAVHPMLITVPLGSFLGAAVFDAVHVLSGSEEASVVAFWMIATGVVGGLAAGLFGFLDWIAVPRGTRARRVGLVHALTNDAVLVLYASSWLLRQDEPARDPSVTALVLAYGALALSGLGGWLGGELVEKLGVGVDDDAHLDAVSSLRASGLISVRTGPVLPDERPALRRPGTLDR